MSAKIQRFVSDMQNIPQVHAIETEGTTLIRSLPLMRPGVWNGTQFTAEDLRQVAANFYIIRDVENVEPSLKPFHNVDGFGNPTPVNANEIMGWWKNLYFDENTQVLYGDVLSVDWSMLSGIREGKLRYLSAEIQDDYQLNDPQAGGPKPIGKAMVGAAWADNPAVKGLGWELVVNLSDYCNPENKNPPQIQHKPDVNYNRADTGSTGTGEKSMGIFATIKDLFLKLGAKEEDLVSLVDPEPEPTQANLSAGTPPAAPGNDELAQLRVDLAASNAKIAQLEAAAVTQLAQARTERLTARVEGLVTGGYVTPGERAGVLAMATALDASDTKIQTFAADGKASEKSVLDEYFDSLKARGPQVRRFASGIPFNGNIVEDADAPLTAEQLDALAPAKD